MIKNRFWQIPNTLSMVRIFCVPAIVILLMWNDPTYHFIAAILFIFAGITDLFDGYLARRTNSVSTIGKLIDPLADKLLMVGTLIMLVPWKQIPAWMVVLILAREFIITGIRGAASAEGLIISANNVGKRKTLLYNIGVVGLILGNQFSHIFIINGREHTLTIGELGLFVVSAGMILSLISAIQYTYQFAKLLSSKWNN